MTESRQYPRHVNRRPRVMATYMAPFQFWIVIRPGRPWVFATTWQEAMQLALEWCHLHKGARL